MKSPGPCLEPSTGGIGAVVGELAELCVAAGSSGVSPWKKRVNCPGDAGCLLWTGISGGFLGNASGAPLALSSPVASDSPLSEGDVLSGLRNIAVALPSSTSSGTGWFSNRSEFRFPSFMRGGILHCAASLRRGSAGADPAFCCGQVTLPALRSKGTFCCSRTVPWAIASLDTQCQQ